MLGTTVLQSGEATLVLLLTLLFFIVFLAMTVWTYSDAQRNSDDSAVLWALVVFFGGVLGFILYFIIGREGA